MADNKTLTLQAHGYIGKGFNQPVNTYSKTYSQVTSLSGRPFWQDVVIDGWRLPFEPIVTITGSKRIVKTVISGSGRRGTVKELICDNDFKLTIQGMFIGKQGHYPTDDITRLKQIIDKPASLEFESIISDLMGVEKVVIEDYKFPHTKGGANQAYQLDLNSDLDFMAEIKLNDL